MENIENDRSLVMSEIMTPEKVNFSGKIHGGYILMYIDQVAYACAARYSGKNIVTLSVDRVVFKKPICVGELVTFNAMVNYVGSTSMEIGVKIISENLKTREKRHTNSCFLTMVAVDENMKPTKVKTFEPKTEVEQHRWNQALERREINKKFLQEHQQRKETLRKKG